MDIVIISIIAFVYVILSILVGFWAERKNRSYWLWLSICILITPFIGALILTFMRKKDKRIKNELF